MATVSDVIFKFVRNSEKIEDLVRSGHQFYFKFGLHYFSLDRTTDPQQIPSFGYHTLYVYPRWNTSVSALVKHNKSADLKTDDFVEYHESDLSDPDKERLAGLYKKLEEKHLHVESIFDDVVRT